MEEDAPVMDGEGGEWSRRFDGGGVVVWIGDLLCWLGEKENVFSVLTSDERETRWPNEIELENISINEGHNRNFTYIMGVAPLANPSSASVYNVSIFLYFKTTSHVSIYLNQLCYAKCISSNAILNHDITPSFKINIIFKVEVKAMLLGDGSIYLSCFQIN